MNTLSKLFGNKEIEKSTNGLSTDNVNFTKRRFISKDLQSIIAFFYILAVLSISTIVWYCGLNSSAAGPILWALASASVGAIFGFLFGIPKILQNGKPPTDNGTKALDYRQQVNTNLTEISDWLTKIIVGLGLINLNNIPAQLSSIADVLSAGMDPSNPGKNKAFALAVILCYLIFGFLFGYLSTRLFLQSAFSRADQEAAILSFTETAIATTEARISNLETKQEYIVSSKSISLNPQMTEEDLSNFPNRDSLQELKDFADKYLLINAESLNERIRLKNQSATEMLKHIRLHEIPKKAVFGMAEQTRNEGLILASANYILNFPETGDLNFIYRIWDKVSRLHVKYRIVQALGELFSKGYISSDDFKDVEPIFTNYEQGADKLLSSLIKGTLELIKNSETQENTITNK